MKRVHLRVNDSKRVLRLFGDAKGGTIASVRLWGMESTEYIFSL